MWTNDSVCTYPARVEAEGLRSLIKLSLLASMLLFGIGMQRATAQNLVVNGEFNQDLLGWENPEPPKATWSSQDANGSPMSGSAQLRNNSNTAGTRLHLMRQCLVISQAGQYRVEAAGFVPPQSLSGRLVVIQNYRISDDCSGGSIGQGGDFIEVGTSWQRTQFDIGLPIAAGSSVELSIAVDKDAAGGEFFAQVDDVRLVLMPLFADGFE